MNRERRKQIREYFRAQPSTWRIEAVIHDGNWYDFDKWRRVARVEKEELEEWIEKNKDRLIVSEQNSYRVSYDEIIEWYDKNDLDVEASIVPNNFPPKLWGGITETDAFLSAPRRRVGTVSFIADDREMLDKCINILKGVAKVMPDTGGRYKAFGLSAVHMKNLLMKGLTEKEYESIDIKTRAVIMQRELVDLPQEWLKEALDFYVNTFAPGILRSSMATISIYLEDRHDIHSQTLIWVITALKKFDEKASVPFSGYLDRVLRHWPYDLPDEHLGKELSRFQRERKRAIDRLKDEGLSVNGIVPDKIIRKEMDMSFEDYVELNQEHENWLSEKNATTLTWEDSSNEKRGELVGASETLAPQVESLNNISHASIKAAISSEDWNSAYRVISQIDVSEDELDENLRLKISDDYSEMLEYHLNR